MPYMPGAGTSHFPIQYTAYHCYTSLYTFTAWQHPTAHSHIKMCMSMLFLNQQPLITLLTQMSASRRQLSTIFQLSMSTHQLHQLFIHTNIMRTQLKHTKMSINHLFQYTMLSIPRLMLMLMLKRKHKHKLNLKQ